MNVKFLATAVVTGLLLNVTTSPAPAAAQTSGQQVGLESDSTFLLTAGSLGLLQVKLGKLAEKKGSSDVVRDFGKRMADEYTRTNEELKGAAKGSAYPAPVMLRQHQQILDQYTRMGKSSFDKNYMAEMVSEHSEAVQLYEREAKNGRVQSLKQLATSLLPAVQGHLALATETAGTVGAHDNAALGSKLHVPAPAHDLDGDQRDTVVGEREPRRVQDAQLVARRCLVGVRDAFHQREREQEAEEVRGRRPEPSSEHDRG